MRDYLRAKLTGYKEHYHNLFFNENRQRVEQRRKGLLGKKCIPVIDTVAILVPRVTSIQAHVRLLEERVEELCQLVGYGEDKPELSDYDMNARLSRLEEVVSGLKGDPRSEEAVDTCKENAQEVLEWFEMFANRAFPNPIAEGSTIIPCPEDRVFETLLQASKIIARYAKLERTEDDLNSWYQNRAAKMLNIYEKADPSERLQKFEQRTPERTELEDLGEFLISHAGMVQCNRFHLSKLLRIAEILKSFPNSQGDRT